MNEYNCEFCGALHDGSWDERWCSKECEDFDNECLHDEWEEREYDYEMNPAGNIFR